MTSLTSIGLFAAVRPSRSLAGQADRTRHGGELLRVGPDYHCAEGEDLRALKILRYAGNPGDSNLIGDSSSSDAKYRGNPLRIFSARPSISLKPDILVAVVCALKQLSAPWTPDIDPRHSDGVGDMGANHLKSPHRVRPLGQDSRS